MRGFDAVSRRLRMHCWRISSGRESTRWRARSNVCSMRDGMGSVLVSKAWSWRNMAASPKMVFARASLPGLDAS